MLDFVIATFGPTIIGILTVPAMRGLKLAIPAVDGLVPWAQQIAVVVIAVILTQLGAFLNVQLPTELSLLTANDLEAVMAGGIALAVHKSRATPA